MTDHKKNASYFCLDTSEGYLDIMLLTPKADGWYDPYQIIRYNYSDWEWLKAEMIKSIEETDEMIEENRMLARKEGSE